MNASTQGSAAAVCGTASRAASPAAAVAQSQAESTADSPEAAAAQMSAEAQAAHDRLSHVFRASLQRGRIHPLYLPMLKYRTGKGAP